MPDADDEKEEVDALCKECGHAFKTYVDRILSHEDDDENKKVECPVCSCTDCQIGH